MTETSSPRLFADFISSTVGSATVRKSQSASHMTGAHGTLPALADWLATFWHATFRRGRVACGPGCPRRQTLLDADVDAQIR